MSQSEHNQPDIFWAGAAGTQYGYWSMPLPFSCDPGYEGNYIFTKIEDGLWITIYIGQGDLNERTNDPAHYNRAIERGATHVHIHATPDEQARLAEEADLLEGHPEAYAPTGCNIRIGG